MRGEWGPPRARPAAYTPPGYVPLYILTTCNNCVTTCNNCAIILLRKCYKKQLVCYECITKNWRARCELQNYYKMLHKCYCYVTYLLQLYPAHVILIIYTVIYLL